MTTRAYIAYTPYHLILVRAMQTAAGGPSAVLVLADEARITATLPEIIDIPGVSQCVQLGPIEHLPHVAAAVTARRNGMVAVDVLRQCTSSMDQLFVFNAVRTETYQLLRSLGAERRVEYVEDGLDAYIPKRVPEPSRLRSLIFRGLYGAPHPHASELLTAYPFESYHYLVPELAREEAKGKVVGIDQRAFVDAVNELSKLVDMDLRADHVTHLWFLAHTDGIADVGAYVNDIERWAESLREGRSIASPAVKPHPRERNAGFLGELERLAGSDPPLVVLPQHVPAELMAPRLTKGCIVRSSLTTFLITSRLLLPNRSMQLERVGDERTWENLRSWDPRISL